MLARIAMRPAPSHGPAPTDGPAVAGFATRTIATARIAAGTITRIIAQQIVAQEGQRRPGQLARPHDGEHRGGGLGTTGHLGA